MKRTLDHDDYDDTAKSVTTMMDTTTESPPTAQQQQQQQSAVAPHTSDKGKSVTTMMDTTTDSPPTAQQQQQSAFAPHISSAPTVTTHEQEMQQYIRDALENSQMNNLVQPVTDVLIASAWRMKWFYDPNTGPQVIDALKAPWKDFSLFSDVLTVEQAKELSRAAMSIARVLLQPYVLAAITQVSKQREVIRNRTAAFQDFVNSVKDAKVILHKTRLTLVDGSLDPPPPPKNTDQLMIEIFRIDLSEYRKELEEKDDLHPGAFNTMHIVRLPLEVPGQDAWSCDTLWITGDDLAVFDVVRSQRKVILLGNPGIGKSWWQWQYLLYSLRPDVYRQLSTRKDFPAGWNGKHLPASVIIHYNAEAKLAIMLDLEKSKTSVTVTAEDRSISYAFARNFDSEGTVLLFEPAADPMITVPYKGLIHMSIVATVLPDLQRYKEFEKNGGIAIFLPCPSKAELLAMAAFLRPLVPSEVASDFSLKQIIARIDEFGPFPRYVFSSTEYAIKGRNSDIAALDTNALEKLASVNTIEKPAGARSAPVSPWFLCFQVDRNHENQYFYSSMHLVVSSQSTLDLVRQKRDSVRLEFKLVALQRLHESGKMENFRLEREWLEDAFVELAAADDGLTWHVYDTSCVKTEKPGTIHIKFDKIVASQSAIWNEMDENVLYYRSDPQFPFFDGVWRQGDRLFGFQATTSKTHPKHVETFKNALMRLKVAPENLAMMQMTIYYVMMPLCFDHHFGKRIPPSFYWKNVEKSKTEIESLSKQIRFVLLRPPNDFSAGKAEV